MKTIVLLTFLLAVASPALTGSRYDQSPNSYLYPAESSTQLKLDEMQRRLDQAELKRLLDNDEQRAAAEEVREAARQQAEEQAEQAKQEATEHADQARQEAEDRADEIANRERIAGANSRNLLYQVLAFLIFALAAYKIARGKRHTKENALKPHEKTGVIIGTTSVLILLSALLVSSPWTPHLDFWQNLMQEYMTIDFWPYIQTKFIVLSCIVLIFYGALVYLEILKAPQFVLSRFDK